MTNHLAMPLGIYRQVENAMQSYHTIYLKEQEVSHKVGRKSN